MVSSEELDMIESGEHTIMLHIPSEMRFINVLDSLLAQIFKVMKFDNETADSVNVAVIEAATNAIKHGNQNNPHKNVEFQFCLASDKLTVSVKDEGRGFKPDAIPNPLSPEGILKPSGKGLLLMKAFMNEVEYCESGTKVKMVKYLN